MTSQPPPIATSSRFRQLARLRLHHSGRIGIFGGSFNPAHQGHADTADTALVALNLKHLWWLITPRNPFKSPFSLADTSQRITSAQTILAKCKGARRMGISRIEEGSQRTASTIRLLRRACPRLNLFWIMGADNMAQFHLWHDSRRLAKSVTTVVINRPGTTASALTSPMARRLTRLPPRRFHTPAKRNRWCFIHGRLSPHSATAIRQSQISHQTPRQTRIRAA